MNFLEELAAEWYSYTGYFVRTNIRTHKRPNGGYDHEIDVLAYSVGSKGIIHLESTWDANTWEARKQRFINKKFVYSRAKYEKIIGGKINTIRKIALVGLGKSTKSDINWGDGIEVVLVPNFIEGITSFLADKKPLKEIVPENFPHLRAMQFAIHFGVKPKPGRTKINI